MAHHMLLLERELGADQRDMQLLDALLASIDREVNFRRAYNWEQAALTLGSIAMVINSAYGYSPRRLLSTGLKDKLLDCDLLTAIYLSVAQRHGLPLKAVVVPRHTFIRWVWPSGQYLNWETTTGQVASDKHFISGRYLRSVQGRSVGKDFTLQPGALSGAYLRNLTNGQFLALSHLNVARGFLDKETRSGGRRSASFQDSLVKATDHLNQAIRLDPKRVEAYYGLGIVNYLRGDHQAAISRMGQAIALFPLEPEVFFSRAQMFLASGQNELGIKDLEEVYRLDPGHPKVPYLLYTAYRNKGDQAQADLWWKRMQAPTRRY
jgi:tetratricopeptide (TPR) repeat protein